MGDARIRLLGLDAPELSQDCTDSDGRAWLCGRDARTRLADLLREGKVECKPEDVDQYDRLLATCSVAGVDLGRTLVAEGLAVSAGRYFTEEINARSKRMGIWAGDFEAPRQWRNDHPRGGGGWSLFGLFGG